MRSFFIILALSFLVLFQAAEACCEQEKHEHAHIESAAQGNYLQITLHSATHQQHGPCDCICHQKSQDSQPILPSPRIELETQILIANSVENTHLVRSEHPATAPPIAENLSLPPPTAGELCSQHCRFLL